MLVTSLEIIKIKQYAKLIQRKYRDREKKFLVEGEHLVKEAAKRGLLLETIELLEASYSTESIIVTKEVMKKISNLDCPPTIIGVCKMIIEQETLGDNVLILDNVQDPGNIGTIIRSATAFNVTTVIMGANSVDIYNPKVVRATQGMIFNINIIRRNLLDEVKRLKDDGYLIITTNVHNGVDIATLNIKDTKSALIMGNEGQGVSDELAKLSNCSVYIPMNKNVESLNVGVATGILLYELEKKNG